MDSTLSNHALGSFLLTHEVRGKTSDEISFTGMGSLKKRWHVSEAEYPKFLNLLHSFLFKEKHRPMNLVEQRRGDGKSPILIDLDFKYPVETALHRRFKMPAIKKFVGMFVDSLREFFDLSSYEALRFFVCLRPQPYEDGKRGVAANRAIKDGIHIECPDIMLPPEGHAILRMVMLQKNAVRECFGEDGYTNTEKDIYDEAMVRKAGWFFYGESKPDVPSYSLAAVYRYEPGEEEYDEEENTVKINLIEESSDNYKDDQLIQLLSIRHGLGDSPFADVREDATEFWEEMKQRCASHVPAVPPPRGAQASPALSAADGGDAPSELSIGPSLLSVMPTQPYTDDEIALAKSLVLDCLAVSRADTYQDWLNVGWCLHCIDTQARKCLRHGVISVVNHPRHSAMTGGVCAVTGLQTGDVDK